ncbi:MAG: multicopper oxidase family protein [Actinomycetes bacterium]
MGLRRPISGRLRLAIAVTATALILGPLAWMWQASRVPGTYSVTDMGYVDLGGGSAAGHALHAGNHASGAGGTSVTSLTEEPGRPADVSVTLRAREQDIRLPSGRVVDGYTLNGQSPGPLIRATEGERVQVRLVNESVPDGITLHWHGVDVPNAEDGVAGVTQDAVEVGEAFTYRFVVRQTGTFWYHSHQVSHEQVRRGLLGPLLLEPREPEATDVDVTALAHLYDGVRTVNGRDNVQRVEAQPGEVVRVRVVNTDNGPMSTWVGGVPFRVTAVDGADLNRPGEVEDTAVLVTAGGRADLQLTMPEDGSAVRVHLGGGSPAVVLGSSSYDAPPTPQPRTTLDMLTYGERAPLAFDPARADRHFEYDIGRRPGFLDGRPGLWWTVNGHLWPDVPMYMVSEGDVVRMRIENHSGDVHPMHLHGHHAVVLIRDGKPSTGSPWWVDSLNVSDGESYEIAFVADNPGIWMDHCHNLPHVSEGLVAHLMYAGVTTPFVVGGNADNDPE